MPSFLHFFSGRISRQFFVEYLSNIGLLTATISEADFLVLPFGYEEVFEESDECRRRYQLSKEDQLALKAELEYFITLSVQTLKPLIVFFSHDSDASLPLPANALVFRTSFDTSNNCHKTFGMPAFIDYLSQLPQQPFRAWLPVPTVSFHGQAAPLKEPLKQKIRRILHKATSAMGFPGLFRSYYLPAYLLRRKAIICLQKAFPKLRVNVVLRHQYLAHEHPDRSSYLQAIVESDYVLCVRGYGNYSFRFFETLRQGRIPLLVDSGGLLPASELIDWATIIPTVPEHRLEEIATILLQYHRSFNKETFIQQQQLMLDIFEKYCQPQSFAAVALQQLQLQVQPAIS